MAGTAGQYTSGTMAKTKLIAALALAVLGIIIVIQNTESVETRLLFATVTMPRAVLLFIATAVGFALGVLASLIVWGKQKPAAK